jgi:hypothetical protein
MPSKRVVKIKKSFKRISLNLTVPNHLSKEARDHILSAIVNFEDAKKVAVLDLDMKSFPVI